MDNHDLNYDSYHFDGDGELNQYDLGSDDGYVKGAPGNLTDMLILIMLVNGNQLCSKRHLAICLYHDSHDVVGDGDYVQ